MKLTQELKDKIDKYFEETSMEVIKEKLPELFKEEFELGKYYTIKDNIGDYLYFKVTSIGDDSIYGYGLDSDAYYFEEAVWCYQSDIEEAEEITREEFLERIKEYAVEELGFKEGVRFNNGNIFECLDYTVHKVTGDIRIHEYFDILITVDTGDTIFKNGIFAEIVKEEVEATVWQPTMELRNKVLPLYPWDGRDDKPIKILQQKWREMNTGKEEWRDIKTE